MLERAAENSGTRSSNEQKIGDFYTSCVDTAAIEGSGLGSLEPELHRISTLTSKAELAELLAHEQLIGVNAFLGLGSAQDFKYARKQIAILDQAGLGLPERDYYFRTGAAAETTRREYLQHIGTMFRLTGESADRADAEVSP